MKKYTVSYAQNREDIILSAFFDKNEEGFYVDVGANDPTHESVTKYFYDRGWHGINIEPIPKLHKKLATSRPRDINLQIGAGPAPSKAELHYYPRGDGLSTMSESMASGYEAKPNEFTERPEVITVDVQPLKTVFKEHLKEGGIQFMKVDVEGFEYEALSGNDWKKYRPEIVCVEANHVDKDWRPLLTGNGYSLVFFDGLNEYYADDKTGRAKKFDYVKGVIFKEPIVNFRLLKDFEEYEESVASLTKDNTALREELAKVQARASQLENTLEEILPLRRHVKRNVKHRLIQADRRILGALTNGNDFKPEPVPASVQGSPKDRLATAAANDVANFAGYNRPAKHHPALPVYKTARTMLKKPRKR